MVGYEDIIILDGCTFWYSNANGDLEAHSHEGFFYRDVRHISTWQLRVDGCPIDPLTSRRVDSYSNRVVGKPAGTSGAPRVSIRRDRFVTEGAHENVVLENLTGGPQTVRLELRYGSDFADVMEAEDGGTFDVRLTPREIWSLCIDVTPVVDGERSGIVDDTKAAGMSAA